MVPRLLLAALGLAALFGPAKAADPVRGAELFNQQCSYCHSLSARMGPRIATPPKGIELEGNGVRKPEPDWPLEIDPGKRGPHLERLFRRAPGAVQGFPYRITLRSEHKTWTEADLDYWIFNHARLLEADRADLIVYLKQATGG